MNGREKLALSLKHRESLIVGAIASPKSFNSCVGECDLVELRMDSLELNDSLKSYMNKCDKPLLVTARGPLEGGQNNLSIEERRQLYLEMIPFAAAIDIELISHKELAGVIEEAKENGVVVIGSFHNFDETPSLDALRTKIGESADVHKFATKVNEESDLDIHRELLKLDSPLSVMGMGTLGADARPEMIQRGSLLNYGYLGDTPTAPHQWPVAKLRSLTR